MQLFKKGHFCRRTPFKTPNARIAADFGLSTHNSSRIRESKTIPAELRRNPVRYGYGRAGLGGYVTRQFDPPGQEV